MPSLLAGVWFQVIASASLLRYQSVRWSVTAGFIILWLVAILAPDRVVSGWDWTRLLLTAVLATLSILAFAASRHLRISLDTRRLRIIGASALFLLALIVSLTFGVGSTAIFCLGFSIVTLQALADRRGTTPWLLIVSLAFLIPFWVWTALDAWSGGLLLLLPIAALAVIGDQHMRDSIAAPVDGDPLSWRAHRFGSWIAMLGAALLILVFGIATDAGNGWVAFGAIGAVVLVALEAGFPRPEDDPRRYALLFCDAAFIWIAFCWLVSL